MNPKTHAGVRIYVGLGGYKRELLSYVQCVRDNGSQYLRRYVSYSIPRFFSLDTRHQNRYIHI